MNAIHRALVVSLALLTAVPMTAVAQVGKPCKLTKSRCKREPYTPEFNACVKNGLECDGSCYKPAPGSVYSDLCVTASDSTCSSTATTITITNGSTSPCQQGAFGRTCASPGTYEPWSGSLTVYKC